MTDQNPITAPAVFGAISEVSRLLAQTGIGKDKTCSGGGNFRYRGIDGVYQQVCPCLVKAGLVILPERIEKEEDLQGGKLRTVRIKVTYKLVSVKDGSSITVESLGEGADVSDKASGKAMSYAYKSMIFQTFAVPVAPVPDSDSEVLTPETPFVSLELVEKSRVAANGGMEAYKEFWQSLSAQERKALLESGEHEKNKTISKEVGD